MIWVRRAIAILLAVFLMIILPLLLFVSQINSTIGNPSFYNGQMEKADIYNFIYDEALPAALEEAESEDTEDNPINTNTIEDAIIATARKIAPPEWLQEIFEEFTEEIVPYFTGKTDKFEYSIELKDKVKAAPAAIKEEILTGEAMGYIYYDLISYAARNITENTNRLPYSISLAEPDVGASLQTVVSRQWIALRIEEAMNAMIPYLIMESETFTITVPIRDRIDSLGNATLELLDRDETYDYIFEELIEPIVYRELNPKVELSYQVSLTRQEVIDGIRRSLPRQWIRTRLEEQINAIISYAKETSISTDINIDMVERKPSILDTLVDIGNEKLEAIYQQLPYCSMTEFKIAKNNTSTGELPYCRPVGIGYEEYKDVLDIDLTSEIDMQIMNVIPDEWIYTQPDLIASMGAENDEFLSEARMHVRNGWTFTEKDLKNRLDDPEDIDELEDIRDWLGNGYMVNQQDIEDEVADFDDARNLGDNILGWLWILWLIPILLLVAIGYLGGYNWKTRSIWALSAMFLASLTVVIAVSLAYSNAIKPEVKEAIDLADLEGLDLVIAEKMNEILENSTRDFSSGMETDALVMVILAGVTLAGIGVWSLYQHRKSRESYALGKQG